MGDSIVYKTPDLYQRTKTGSIRTWSVEVHEDSADQRVSIVTRSGVLGGRELTSTRNIGRGIGGRTTKATAIHVANRRYREKMNNGYSHVTEDNIIEESIPRRKNILPMIGIRWSRGSAARRWPAYAQPSIAGVRCLAIIEGGYCRQLYSERGTTLHGFEDIHQELNALATRITTQLPGVERVILDGQLYHCGLSEKEVTQIVRERRDWSKKGTISYAVYDCYVPGSPRLPFTDRYELLSKLLCTSYGRVTMVPTTDVENPEEFMAHTELWKQHDNHGAVFRNMRGPYTPSSQSIHVQYFR